jgi:hypothetical protein
MRFRISTILLGLAVIVVLLAWYADRQRSDDITGTWHYPALELGVGGYQETLKIRPNQTFSKHQMYRIGELTWEGTYSIATDGLVVFHITTYSSNKGPFVEIDKQYRCRCAIDSGNYLIIRQLDFDVLEHANAASALKIGSLTVTVDPGLEPVEWHCYSRLSPEDQWQALIDRLSP